MENQNDKIIDRSQTYMKDMDRKVVIKVVKYRRAAHRINLCE